MKPSLTNLYRSLLTLFAITAFGQVNAQLPLNFNRPALVEGEDLKAGAIYKYTGVIIASNGQPLTDCFVKIETVSPGVELVAIDKEESANLMAFEPVIEHKQTIGAAAVSFSFEFRPHDPAINTEGKYIFPALAASLSGLSGQENAQAFAECAIGKNGSVWMQQENGDVMVARSGEAFRAQYKWNAKKSSASLTADKIVFANQEVSGFKLKIGINSKGNPFVGRTAYNLSLTEALPSTQTNVVRYVSRTENLQLPEWIEEEKQTDTLNETKETNDIQQLNKIKLSDDLLVFIPDEMVSNKVMINIYDQKGDLKRKIIEESAPNQVMIKIGDLASGAYKIEIQSGEKKFEMLTIRSSRL